MATVCHLCWVDNFFPYPAHPESPLRWLVRRGGAHQVQGKQEVSGGRGRAAGSRPEMEVCLEEVTVWSLVEEDQRTSKSKSCPVSIGFQVLPSVSALKHTLNAPASPGH